MEQQRIAALPVGCTKLCDSVFVTEQTFDGVTVRGALVVGTRSAIMFDTLVFPGKLRELLTLCPGREVIAVYSHADWDHVWGTSGITPARIVSHGACAERFAGSHDVEKTWREYVTKFPSELADVRITAPTVTFQSELTLDLGEVTVELRHCPGHTADSIIGIVPERGVLLGADCIESPLPILNEGAGYLERWIAMLDELARDNRISICVPSHGKISGTELLVRNRDYLRSLMAEEVEAPEGLDAFYEAAHRENREKVAAQRDALAR